MAHRLAHRASGDAGALPKATPADSRGRGQIIPRGHATFLVRVYLGRDASGKRQYTAKTVKGTTRQAEQALTKLLGTVDEGRFTPPTWLTLSEYLTGFRTAEELAGIPKGDPEALRGWLGGRRDLGLRTRRSYAERMRNDVLPELGTIRLEHLTRGRLQTLVRFLEVDRGLSPRTVGYTVTILKAALEQAVIDGLLPKNPADHLVLPRREHKELVVLSPAQIMEFLEKSREAPHHALWTFLLTTGVRPQEALALTWDDVDFESGVCVIRRALIETRSGVWESGPTKTQGSRRNIAIPSEVVEILRVQQARLAGTSSPSDDASRRGRLVFPNQDGGFHWPCRVRRWWKDDLRAAGLPVVRLYAARHSHATALLAANVHPKVASERLGHSSTRITLDIYSHVTPSMQQQAAAVVGALMFRKAAVLT